MDPTALVTDGHAVENASAVHDSLGAACQRNGALGRLIFQGDSKLPFWAVVPGAEGLARGGRIRLDLYTQRH
jgi:hypothetical protein